MRCRRPAPITASARRTSCAPICGISRKSGVDQTVFIQQGGRNQHKHICEALELFASEVMPEFRAREIEREKRKQEELAPYIEKAMARKQAMPPLRDEEIPVYVALGRKVAEEGTGTERQKQNAKLWADAAKVTLSDPGPSRHQNPRRT